MARKVDIDYVQGVEHSKANKVDLEGCISLIERIHERLKHLAIL